ncbi:MAG: hypothetical protein HC794_03905 [Nitrospiraceae bacterium]|nr:hypothetical protein [Nitrospiraceae bacterium]
MLTRQRIQGKARRHFGDPAILDTDHLVLDGAAALDVGEETVKTHVGHLLGKLGVESVARFCARAGRPSAASGGQASPSAGVMVIAPDGFMNAAIAENVFAGNAMTRRTQWQYAVLLERNPFGHVDQSIGKNVANGNVGLIAPNRLVTKDFEEITLDGVKMVFQFTPGTEAPAEMNVWFPDWKIVDMAENANATQHNILTPRGAVVKEIAALGACDWSLRGGGTR